MQLTIEPNNGMPIFEQVVRQIKVCGGRGHAGARPTSAQRPRALQDFGSQPQHDSTRLPGTSNEEVLESLRGRGIAVCAGAKRRCVSDRQLLLGQRLSAVVEEAIRGGLDPDRLREMFEKAIKQATKNEGASMSEINMNSQPASATNLLPSLSSMSTRSSAASRAQRCELASSGRLRVRAAGRERRGQEYADSRTAGLSTASIAAVSACWG